jgi:hypothetical protein
VRGSFGSLPLLKGTNNKGGIMSAYEQVTITSEDTELIVQIVERALKEPDIERCTNFLDLSMDIEVVHFYQGLKLERWLKAPDLYFLHDIVGIMVYTDRETGGFKNAFCPMFKQQAKEKNSTMQ